MSTGILALQVSSRPKIRQALERAEAHHQTTHVYLLDEAVRLAHDPMWEEYPQVHRFACAYAMTQERMSMDRAEQHLVYCGLGMLADLLAFSQRMEIFDYRFTFKQETIGASGTGTVSWEEGIRRRVLVGTQRTLVEHPRLALEALRVAGGLACSGLLEIHLLLWEESREIEIDHTEESHKEWEHYFRVAQECGVKITGGGRKKSTHPALQHQLKTHELRSYLSGFHHCIWL